MIREPSGGDRSTIYVENWMEEVKARVPR